MKKMEALNKALMTFFETYRLLLAIIIFMILHYGVELLPYETTAIIVVVTLLTYLLSPTLIEDAMVLLSSSRQSIITRDYSRELPLRAPKPSATLLPRKQEIPSTRVIRLNRLGHHSKKPKGWPVQQLA